MQLYLRAAQRSGEAGHGGVIRGGVRTGGGGERQPQPRWGFERNEQQPQQSDSQGRTVQSGGLQASAWTKRQASQAASHRHVACELLPLVFGVVTLVFFCRRRRRHRNFSRRRGSPPSTCCSLQFDSWFRLSPSLSCCRACVLLPPTPRPAPASSPCCWQPSPSCGRIPSPPCCSPPPHGLRTRSCSAGGASAAPSNATGSESAVLGAARLFVCCHPPPARASPCELTAQGTAPPRRHPRDRQAPVAHRAPRRRAPPPRGGR